MPKNKSARQRKSKSAESGGKIIAVRALTGAAVGAAVFFILSAITALAAFKQDIPAEKLGAAALAISAVSEVSHGLFFAAQWEVSTGLFRGFPIQNLFIFP